MLRLNRPSSAAESPKEWAAADALAAVRLSPSRRLDVVSATRPPPLGPRAALRRRLHAFAMELGDTCGRAVRGRNRSAFERRCVPSSIVSLQSRARHAPFPRLAGRLPERSRCDADLRLELPIIDTACHPRAPLTLVLVAATLAGHNAKGDAPQTASDRHTGLVSLEWCHRCRWREKAE